MSSNGHSGRFSGRVNLKSGNTMYWEQVLTVGRGATRATFSSDPSEEDKREGWAFIRQRRPADAVECKQEETSEGASAKMVFDHITHHAGDN